MLKSQEILVLKLPVKVKIMFLKVYDTKMFKNTKKIVTDFSADLSFQLSYSCDI